MLPDLFFVYHFNIFQWADCCTGPAGCAFLICDKVLVGIVEMTDEPRIGKPFQER